MYPEFRLSHTGSSTDAQDVTLNYCISIAAPMGTHDNYHRGVHRGHQGRGVGPDRGNRIPVSRFDIKKLIRYRSAACVRSLLWRPRDVFFVFSLVSFLLFVSDHGWHTHSNIVEVVLNIMPPNQQTRTREKGSFKRRYTFTYNIDKYIRGDQSVDRR